MTIFQSIQEPFYFNYCHKLTKCKDDAHDLMMTAALIIYDKKYPLDNPKGLFCKIAKNYFINQKRTLLIDCDIPDVPTTYEDTLDMATLTAILSEPAKSKREFVTKEVFKLYMKLGTSQSVANYTSIPQQTIHSQIQKFKNYVRNRLND